MGFRFQGRLVGLSAHLRPLALDLGIAHGRVHADKCSKG